MTSTDDHGYIKYWQANLNNVHTFQAHNDPVRASRCDKLMPSSSAAVLLVLVIISNSSNVVDKLFLFRKKMTRYINVFKQSLGAVLKCTCSLGYNC